VARKHKKAASDREIVKNGVSVVRCHAQNSKSSLLWLDESTAETCDYHHTGLLYVAALTAGFQIK